jgi:hypothetical protein
MLILILTIFFARANDLKTDTAVIKRTELRTEYNSRGKASHFVDIFIDKPYIIHLSSDEDSDKWPLILDSKNNGQEIFISYFPHFFQSPIRSNPEQLFINHKEILAYDRHKAWLYLLIPMLIAFTLLGFYFSYYFIKKYWVEILPKDKLLYKENKWKLIKAWLFE